MKFIENWWLSIDKLNFIFIISLGVTGVILSFSLNEHFYYINRHSVFFIFSIFLLIFFSQVGDKNIRRVSLVGFFILIFMLILVSLLDFEIKGAKRWLKIFSFTIQPSEIIKPFFIVLTAWCISQTINSKKYYIILLFIFFGILISLIILQPDLGMTILIAATFFCQLFVAGLPLLLVFVAFGLLITMSISSYYLFDHVEKRINLAQPMTQEEKEELALDVETVYDPESEEKAIAAQLSKDDRELRKIVKGIENMLNSGDWDSIAPLFGFSGAPGIRQWYLKFPERKVRIMLAGMKGTKGAKRFLEEFYNSFDNIVNFD